MYHLMEVAGERRQGLGSLGHDGGADRGAISSRTTVFPSQKRTLTKSMLWARFMRGG